MAFYTERDTKGSCNRQEPPVPWQCLVIHSMTKTLTHTFQWKTAASQLANARSICRRRELDKGPRPCTYMEAISSDVATVWLLGD